MTDYQHPTGGIATDQPAPGESTSQDRSDQAKQEAGATKEHAKQEAGATAQTAKAEAGAVADEAKSQARNVVHEAKRVGVARADEQTANLAGALRQVQTQAQALLDGRADEAGALGDYTRQLADAVSRYADRVDDLGFEGIVRETSNFARRRPAAFLLIAAGAGLAVGRLGRGIKDAPSDGSASTGTGGDEPSAALPPRTSTPTPGVAAAPAGTVNPAATEERTRQ